MVLKGSLRILLILEDSNNFEKFLRIWTDLKDFNGPINAVYVLNIIIFYNKFFLIAKNL